MMEDFQAAVNEQYANQRVADQYASRCVSCGAGIPAEGSWICPACAALVTDKRAQTGENGGYNPAQGSRFSAFTALEQVILRMAFSYADDEWTGNEIENKTFNRLFSELKAAMRAKGEADK